MNHTMTILQLGPYPPPHGGVSHSLVAIRQFLHRRGVSNLVINLTRHRDRDADGIYYPKSWIQTLLLLLRLRYDIIHIHFGGRLAPRLLGLYLICCLLPRSKTVLTFHSGGYPRSREGRSARRSSLRGFVFRRFDVIIAVNEEIVELFRKFGVPDDRIRLICPLALVDLRLDQELKDPLKGFFNGHEPVLVTVGRLETEYDLALQIDALDPVRKRYPKAGLVIIGSGSLEEELRNRIDSKSFGEHIVLCGDLDNSITLRAISDSDLMLRTTLYDGDSVAVREALHLGTPVIATDTCMRPEGVTLIPKSDPGALLEAIDEHLRGKTASVACQSSDENIEAVFDLYYELVGEVRSEDKR